MTTRIVLFLGLLLLHGSRCAGQDDATSPANDECINATPITINDAPIASTTVGGTTSGEFDIALQQCDGQTFDIGTPGVWFKVVGNGGTLKFSTCSATTTPPPFHRISIHQGSACDALVCMVSAVDDDADPECAQPNSSSQATIRTNPGETYLVLVHDETRSISGGSFDFSVQDVTPPPSNDACNNATILNGGITEVGTTLGATEKSLENCNGVDSSSSPGVWYEIPSAPTNVQEEEETTFVFLCTDSEDLSIAILGSCGVSEACIATMAVESFEFECASEEEFASAVSWVSSPNSEYLVLVHGASDAFFGVTYARSSDGGGDGGSGGGGSGNGGNSQLNKNNAMVALLASLTAAVALLK